MRTLKNLWWYSKSMTILLVFTTVGWIGLAGLLWWLLLFIGAGFGWIAVMAGTTALLVFLFWIIWSGFAREVN